MWKFNTQGIFSVQSCRSKFPFLIFPATKSSTNIFLPWRIIDHYSHKFSVNSAMYHTLHLIEIWHFFKLIDRLNIDCPRIKSKTFFVVKFGIKDDSTDIISLPLRSRQWMMVKIELIEGTTYLSAFNPKTRSWKKRNTFHKIFIISIIFTI